MILIRLGSVALFCSLSFTVGISSDEFKLEAFVQKKSVYVGEPFKIVYQFAKHHDHEGVDFKFQPPALSHLWLKTSDSGREFEKDHYTLTRHTLVVSAQQAGVMQISSTVMKVAKRVYRRDAWGSLTSKIEWVSYPFPALTVNVFELPGKVRIVGDLNVSTYVDRQSVLVGQPVVWTIHVRGEGNLEDIAAFEPSIKDVTVFKEKPSKRGYWENDKYISLWKQKISIISDTNYTIPSYSLEWLDPQKSKVRRFDSQLIDIEVIGSHNDTFEILKAERKGEKKVESIHWVEIFTGLLLGWFLGMATMLLRLKKMTWSSSPLVYSQDARKLLAFLLKHLDRDDARKIAISLEKKLYEGKEYIPNKKSVKKLIEKLNKL